MILHIVIPGSNPGISIYKAREAQPGRARYWSYLGYKFESYLEQQSVNVLYFYIFLQFY